MRKKVIEDEPGCFSTKVRYMVLFLGSACIASICSNMTVINFTQICMGSLNKTTGESQIFKDDDPNRGPLDFSQRDRSMIQWSSAIGTLLAAWPFHLLYERFGARHVFFVAGVISTLATALIPLAAHASFLVFLGLRFFQGISFGADFAAIGLITVNWASLKQHGFFISLLTSFSQISVIFTMPVSGELCAGSGWESAFYVHAAVSGTLFTAWFLFYRNDPARHGMMTEVELEKIKRGKDENAYKQHKAPVKAIMTNPVMWAVWLSAFGELMMSQFIVMYAPMYLKEVLGFKVNHTGYFVAVPRLMHLLFKIMSGIASDKIKFLTEKIKMIIFNTIALMVSGIFFCILGFVPKEFAYYALGVLLIIECSTGCICGGFYKCATLVARQHSHFVLSQIQFIKCVSLFIEPALVFVICKNNTLAEWRIVFMVHGVLLILGNVVFSFFATDEPAEFTKESASDPIKNAKELEERARLTDPIHDAE